MATPSTPPTLDLRFGQTVYNFVQTAATGLDSRCVPPRPVNEAAAFGSRGDGKTQGAFGCMVAHAKLHHEAGYPLPCKWLGVADTFESHKNKTHGSLVEPLWCGLWRLSDQGHVAEFVLDGTVLVSLRLFGVEDQAAIDRVRAASHGLWFEEPAPASVLVQSSGLSSTAWAMGLTSLRLPSHCHPAFMTLNYPDEDHWTAQRFVFRPHPGTAYFRIPAGERASEDDRSKWREALADRPDMLRRLLDGQFGTLMLGAQVAVGFNADTHVAYGRRLHPSPEWGPLWIGQDADHTCATVIGQRQAGRFCILAALVSERAGIREHLEGTLLPWLAQHAPWAMGRGRDHEAIRVHYDPALDTDEQTSIEANALRVMRAMLPGVYRPGPVSWPGRRDPMLSVLNRLAQGTAVLQLDPEECVGLIKALNGGWYYPTGPSGAVSRDLPKKPNHPHEDYGDAFCYLIEGMAPTRDHTLPPRRLTVKQTYNILDHGRERRPFVRSS